MLKVIQNFIKNHNVISIISAFVFIVIVIPLILNFSLYINIITHNSTDGDWLGFWGSFLGGIIGGFITLIGVLITLRKDDNNKKRDAKKSGPFLVILEKRINIFKHIRETQLYLHNEQEVDDYKEAELIQCDLINLGFEHAISVKIKWQPPTYNELCLYLKKKDIEAINHKIDQLFNNICNEVVKQRIETINLIKAYNNEEIHKYNICSDLSLLITYLSACIINKGDDCYTYENIPLGKMNIYCNNILGDVVDIYYEMKGDFLVGSTTNNIEKNYFFINFKLSNYILRRSSIN